MSRSAKKRRWVRSKMPLDFCGQRFSDQIRDDPDVRHVGDRARRRGRRRAACRRAAPGAAAGSARCSSTSTARTASKGSWPPTCPSADARRGLRVTTPSRRRRASSAAPGVELDPPDLARPGALEELAVGAGGAARVEDAQTQRVDELEQDGLDVAVVGVRCHGSSPSDGSSPRVYVCGPHRPAERSRQEKDGGA